MQLLGLYREAECSPGRHRSNDGLLLEQVASVLRTHGCHVDLKTIASASCPRGPEPLVFSMCQGRRALDLLARWEQNGARIVNSPRAALNTYRDRLSVLMESAEVRFPATTVVATTVNLDANIDVNGGLWLKRGDLHASVAADVQWIDSTEGLRAGLNEFASRGIVRAALQPHHQGDEIKFYGVAGGRFFHWFYPGTPASSAASTADGEGTRSPLNVAALERLAERAAAAAGLDIYGGDVIVAPSGELTLIDLNDWPSFAPCRDRAADAIAGFLMGYLNAAWNPGLVSSANESAL